MTKFFMVSLIKIKQCYKGKQYYSSEKINLIKFSMKVVCYKTGIDKFREIGGGRIVRRVVLVADKRYIPAVVSENYNTPKILDNFSSKLRCF